MDGEHNRVVTMGLCGGNKEGYRTETTGGNSLHTTQQRMAPDDDDTVSMLTVNTFDEISSSNTVT